MEFRVRGKGVPSEKYSNKKQMEPKNTPDSVEALWEPLRGVDRPAIILHLNHFVMEHDITIPCEIGMTSFSVKRGIIETYSTPIEPVAIPFQYQTEAWTRSGFFGVPMDPPIGRQKLHHKRRIMAIEKFISKHAIPEIGKSFIFCAREDFHAVQDSLAHYYSHADKRFTHKIHPLEQLMVALSKRGLQTSAPSERWTSLRSSIEAVQRFCMYKSNTGAQVTTDMIIESYRTFHDVNPDHIQMLGKVRRFAASKPDHPAAVLGVFLKEEAASSYLGSSRITYGTKLACGHHDISANPEETERTQIDQSTYCALSVSKRLAYLILDVVMPNFGIEPQENFHYPEGGHFPA